MPRVFEGQLTAAGLRFAIVVSRFNSFITERLHQGAMDALVRAGANPDLVDVIKVPGSWEVPLVASEVARQHRYDAVICLSCVIRGETPHFEYIASEAASGLQLAALETGVPVAFGVLTLENIEQAESRLDKGAEAVRTALEMADAFAQLRASAAAAR